MVENIIDEPQICFCKEIYFFFSLTQTKNSLFSVIIQSGWLRIEAHYVFEGYSLWDYSLSNLPSVFELDFFWQDHSIVQYTMSKFSSHCFLFVWHLYSLFVWYLLISSSTVLSNRGTFFPTYCFALVLLRGLDVPCEVDGGRVVPSLCWKGGWGGGLPGDRFFLSPPLGLGLLVTWLSDPDNLNQLVVSQLDSVTPKDSVEELYGSDLELTSLALQEGEDAEVWVTVGTTLPQSADRRGRRLCHTHLFLVCLFSVAQGHRGGGEYVRCQGEA